ncbi:MAG: hypothetical protein GY832_33610, partial [Chloroflexi bacterium]|nr:hypothetical protein [Chloroflexota bacterium]
QANRFRGNPWTHLLFISAVPIRVRALTPTANSPPPALHHPRPKGTKQCTTWTDQGETARERTGVTSAAEAMRQVRPMDLWQSVAQGSSPGSPTGKKAMPSEVSALCFSGGEQWGRDEGHHPQTGNHRDKANPSAAITPLLVVTDNASHRFFPSAPGPRVQGNAPPGVEQGGDGEGSDWGTAAAEVMGRSGQ